LPKHGFEVGHEVDVGDVRAGIEAVLEPDELVAKTLDGTRTKRNAECARLLLVFQKFNHLRV